MKILVRASCGHEAIFDEPGFEKLSDEHRQDYLSMLTQSATCDECGRRAEALSRELEHLAKLHGDKSFDY
jgi:hypothetical protein